MAPRLSVGLGAYPAGWVALRAGAAFATAAPADFGRPGPAGLKLGVAG